MEKCFVRSRVIMQTSAASVFSEDVFTLGKDTSVEIRQSVLSIR